MNDLQGFQRHCRLLRALATCVFAGLSILLLIGVVLPLLHTGGMAKPTVMLGLVHASPGICYLWALWVTRQALADMASGKVFHATVAQALRRIGGSVILGAILSIFAVTNLSRIIQGGHGGFAYFDLSGIVLAVVGATLIVLARLVEQARALEHELDEMI